MKRVILESPLRGDIDRNLRYLERAIADSLSRNEAPFASHAIYPGALNDLNHIQRHLGIIAGFTWHQVAELLVVYEDYSITEGMLLGIENAAQLDLPIEYRRIGENPEDNLRDNPKRENP